MTSRAFNGTMGGALSLAALIAFGGCGQTHFDAALNTSVEDVQAILDDDMLSSQETREALADLGIDEVTINALLRADRVANQFGGDLRSAFLKVSGGRLNELTPDEVQVYGDATAVTSYSDTEAQAIVDLFADAGVTTSDGLEALLDTPSFALPIGIDDENLREVFVNFNPNDVISQIE